MIRVLIVDDHAIVRSGLYQLLTTTDDIEPVGGATNGEQAVAMAAELHPDVVLMDLSMPDTDGIAATRRIVKKDPGIHVLVLTSFSDPDRIRGAVEAGAEGYLLKESATEEILTGIRQLAEGIGSPLDPKAARELLSSRRGPREEIKLTTREQQVLQMLRAGMSNRAIARQLGIRERTVKAHLTSVFHSLGVTDRTQAALWAQRHDKGPPGQP